MNTPRLIPQFIFSLFFRDAADFEYTDTVHFTAMFFKHLTEQYPYDNVFTTLGTQLLSEGKQEITIPFNRGELDFMPSQDDVRIKIYQLKCEFVGITVEVCQIQDGAYRGRVWTGCRVVEGVNEAIANKETIRIDSREAWDDAYMRNFPGQKLDQPFTPKDAWKVNLSTGEVTPDTVMYPTE